MNKGIFYIATGETYYEEAVESAKTVKSHCDIPISIATTHDSIKNKKADIFENLIIIDDAYYDVRDKPYNMHKTPYEKTIFLDADTTILDDISELFDLLDRVDVAFTFSSGRYLVKTNSIPDSFPEPATGVIAYRKNERTLKFLSTWKELQKDQIECGRPRKNEWIPGDSKTLEEKSSFGNKVDQPTFREAVYKTNVNYSVLPPEYNFGTAGRGFAKFEVKILASNNRKLLKNIINEKLTDRVIVGDYLHFPYENKKIRFRGIPLVSLLKYHLPIRTLAKKAGILEQLKSVRDVVGKKYNMYRFG